MEKSEILEEFVKYCNDTNGNTKSKKSKLNFANDLIVFLYSYKKLKLEEIEETRENIINILKYNALTIEKIKNKYKKMGV
jgi:hypothetical protein